MAKDIYYGAVNITGSVSHIVRDYKEAKGYFDSKVIEKDQYISSLKTILEDIKQTAGFNAEAFVSSLRFYFSKNMRKLRRLYKKVNKELMKVSK